jgi:hypothetical protein
VRTGVHACTLCVYIYVCVYPQSLLTGESHPVDKQLEPVAVQNAVYQDKTNILFSVRHCTRIPMRKPLCTQACTQAPMHKHTLKDLICIRSLHHLSCAPMHIRPWVHQNTSTCTCVALKDFNGCPTAASIVQYSVFVTHAQGACYVCACTCAYMCVHVRVYVFIWVAGHPYHSRTGEGYRGGNRGQHCNRQDQVRQCVKLMHPALLRTCSR